MPVLVLVLGVAAVMVAAMGAATVQASAMVVVAFASSPPVIAVAAAAKWCCWMHVAKNLLVAAVAAAMVPAIRAADMQVAAIVAAAFVSEPFLAYVAAVAGVILCLRLLFHLAEEATEGAKLLQTVQAEIVEQQAEIVELQAGNAVFLGMIQAMQAEINQRAMSLQRG